MLRASELDEWLCERLKKADDAIKQVTVIKGSEFYYRINQRIEKVTRITKLAVIAYTDWINEQ